ncbi:MAG: dienelactone hydrolase family protein [Steroidobacteraceae bacterium]
MRIPNWFLPLAACSALAGCAQDKWILAEGQHPQGYEARVTQVVGGKFLLFLPSGFQAHGKTRYPLLIFLHGSGEAGDDLEKVKAHGPPEFVASRPDFPFIVASPQSASDSTFDPVALNAMLDELLARLPIDKDRVYLTGLSLGGIWSYGWASRNPERFAAIAPVCGRWDPGDACKLKNMPIWAFHGALDDAVPIEGDKAMIAAINACGGNAKLSVYPDIGHNVWDAAYGEPKLYEWLLQQRRHDRAK